MRYWRNAPVMSDGWRPDRFFQFLNEPLLYSAQSHGGDSERGIHAERSRDYCGVGDVQTFVVGVRLSLLRLVEHSPVLVADSVVDASSHPTAAEWMTVRRQQLSDFSALLLMDTLGVVSHSRLARL